MENRFDKHEHGRVDLERGTDSAPDLGEEDPKLLHLASALGQFQPPARNPDNVAAQIEIVLAAAKTHIKPQVGYPTRQKSTQTSKTSWFYRIAAATGALYLLIACVMFIGLGVGFTRGVSWYLNRLQDSQAIIQAVNGVLEIQEKDGRWTQVQTKAQLTPGVHLRTRYLSSAEMKLKDGSQIFMGPHSEIIIEQMDWSLRGVRIVRVTQWSGSTEHRVSPSKSTASLYEIKTPTATAAAQGTVFSVRVEAQTGTTVEVMEGIVEVSGMGRTISMTPGWFTSVAPNQPPTEPVLFLSGEGILQGEPEALTIAGQAVVFNSNALLIGDVVSGDLVAFSGRQLADGSMQIDRLEKLMPALAQEFSLTSPIEAIARNAIVAAETVFAVNETSHISIANAEGGVATIEGVVQADEPWLATQVYTPGTEQPFQFTGIVQKVEEKQWMVSGVEIQVDQQTDISASIEEGDLVQVWGWILENGAWHAKEIHAILPPTTYFDFTGIVSNTDPWIIAGVELETRLWTAIDPEIKQGDLVRVRGPILEDGVWVAASISKIVPEPEKITLEFIGTVNSTDPWVISGIVLIVDAQTEITGELQIGSLVSVRATRQTNGTWHADHIQFVAPSQVGCVTYAALAASLEDEILTLQDGATIDLNAVEQVDGEIEAGSTLLIVKCLDADGKVHYPLIKVLLNPPDEPTPTPTPTPTSTATSAPDSIILPNCYQISFLGFTKNGDGTSTWRYRVEELSCAQDLSNWVLELPFCASVVDAAPSPWEEVHPDPNIHLNGIKWEVGAGFVQGVFTLTLSGDLDLGMTRVGAKGPDVATAAIQGPVCYQPSPTPTLTPTETLTPTVTPTPTVTGSPTTTPTHTITVTPSATIAPPVLSGPIVITDNGQTLTINCNGATVEVRGNGNNITILGSCSSLTIRGNANRISIQSFAGLVIVDTGNENTVTQR